MRGDTRQIFPEMREMRVVNEGVRVACSVYLKFHTYLYPRKDDGRAGASDVSITARCLLACYENTTRFR